MKKYTGVFLALIMLTGCAPDGAVQKVQSAQQEVEQTVQADEEKTALDAAKEVEETLTTQRTIDTTLRAYTLFYWRDGNGLCENGLIPSSQSIEAARETVDILNVYAQPGINVECYVADAYSGNYYDTSDECILARRNNKKSTVCYFNYKKYLPATSQISTDADFVYLAEAYNHLYSFDKEKGTMECTYCNNLQEKTTAEKEECKKQIKQFLQNISDKKVPLCKNKVNKKYMDFLKEGIESFSFLSDMTTAEINSNATSAAGAYLMNGIYQSAYQEAWEDAIKNFGFENFCSTKGYQSDVAQINKSRKSNRNHGIVSLN